MIILLLNSIAAIIILVNGLFFTINKMSWRTCHGMRFAWLAISTGALGVLLGPVFGYPPPGAYATVLHVGFALFILFDRRKPGDLRGLP